VFEIGNSLREARLRQQLDLPELEQQTKIRSKYLKALEDEQFDILPAPTYIRGFLRSYADALGLEGQLYVDEYNSRFITGEEDAPLRPRDYQRRPQPIGHRFETRGVLVAVGAIAVVFALVIAAWKYGSNETATPTVPKVPAIAKKKHATVKRYARLMLTAANGPSWVQVRALGPTGPVKYEGTMSQGDQLPFTRRPFLFRRWYVAVAKPQNVVAQVNGRVVAIPGARRGKPTQLIVTTRAILKAPPPA
jgi:Helix-turn-helix domain/RodZ C-terminal domain